MMFCYSCPDWLIVFPTAPHSVKAACSCISVLMNCKPLQQSICNPNHESEKS